MSRSPAGASLCLLLGVLVWAPWAAGPVAAQDPAVWPVLEDALHPPS